MKYAARFFYLFILIQFSFCGNAFSGSNLDKELEFVKTVMLGPEYGGGGQYVALWKRSPTLSVFSDDPEDHEIVQGIVDEINALIEDSKTKIKVTKPAKQNAAFKVFFAPQKQFTELAREYHFEYVAGNKGYFYIWWDGTHALSRAIVLISENLRDHSRRHFVREEITQAMGLSNDSPLFKNSIFYGTKHSGGKARGYSELDKRLIHFAYAELNPGDGPEQVQDAFKRAWS